MSSKTEDFPTPVSPTRRMVYGVFVLFFDVLIIPFLRDSTSLKKIRSGLHQQRHRNLLDSGGVTRVCTAGATRVRSNAAGSGVGRRGGGYSRVEPDLCLLGTWRNLLASLPLRVLIFDVKGERKSILSNGAILAHIFREGGLNTAKCEMVRMWPGQH